jgi:hypothetical protein
VWGYSYTNLRGLYKVNGEMALIMTVYNIKRVLNILAFDDLMTKIRTWKPDYKAIGRHFKKTNPIFHQYRMIFWVSEISRRKNAVPISHLRAVN